MEFSSSLWKITQKYGLAIIKFQLKNSQTGLGILRTEPLLAFLRMLSSKISFLSEFRQAEKEKDHSFEIGVYVYDLMWGMYSLMWEP